MLYIIPIFLAIILGLLFPYAALSIMPFGYIFFFGLMFLAGLRFKVDSINEIKKLIPQLLFGLIFSGFFSPLMQLIFARSLLTDPQYIFGVFFSALAPSAIVAPYFTKQASGDDRLSYLLMVISSLTFPFIALLMLTIIPENSMSIDILALTKGILLLACLPVILSAVVVHFLPSIHQKFFQIEKFANPTFLCVLIFILFGSAVSRFNFSYASVLELLKILLICFFQDFGILIIVYFFAIRFFSLEQAIALTVSLSMKNSAIVAAILLFISPSAAIPATLMFIPHAILFASSSWIIRMLQKLRPTIL